jgi:DNA-directed RNA polymerase alpha subunit
MASSASMTPLESLGLSVRALRCLQSRGVTSVEHLCTFTAVELGEYQSWGEVTLREVRERLAERGLRLRPEASSA